MSQELSIVEAGARLDLVCFNPMVEWLDHVIHVGAYTCPRCTTEFEINTSTLRQFELSNHSALGPDWERRCLAARPLGAWEWAFDFRCRGCGARVRLIYIPDREIAMGVCKYRVLLVLEEIGEDRPTSDG